MIKQAVQKSIAKGDDKALPEYKGVFVWEDVSSKDNDLNFNGLKGNMLFGADTLQLLEQAIDNAGGSDNLSSNNTYKSELNEMGEGALLRVVGDAQQVIENTGNSQQAEKVPFVKALGIFTSKTTVTADGLAEQSTLATDNEDLSDERDPARRRGGADAADRGRIRRARDQRPRPDRQVHRGDAQAGQPDRLRAVPAGPQRAEGDPGRSARRPARRDRSRFPCRSPARASTSSAPI